MIHIYSFHEKKFNYIIQTVLATLLQIYPCLFCNTGKIKLSIHLKKNQNCMEQYFHLFKCQSVETVSSQVYKIKTLSNSCRQKDKRRLENEEQKKKKRSRTSEESILNFYNINTSFSNTYKCSLCKLNLQESNVRKLKLTEYSKFALDRINRRFGFYFICRKCEQNPAINDENANFCPELQISRTEIDNFVLYKVSYIQEEQDEDNDDVSLNNSLTESNPELEFDPNLALEELINQIPSFNEHGDESELENDPNLAPVELINQIPSSNEYGDESEVLNATFPRCQTGATADYLGRPLKTLFCNCLMRNL